MSDLSLLGKALREERGAPPVTWQHEQCRRLRNEQVAAPQRPQFRWAMAIALTSALLGIGYFGLMDRADPLASAQDSSSAWLDAHPSSLSYRTPDGSNIQLVEGSSGRFSSDEDGSQFDLHGGSATFQVAKRSDQNWTVVAGRYSLHVVGTRFTVGYQRGDISVWVEEGLVAVSVPQRADLLLLESGDRLEASGDSLTIRTRNDGVASIPSSGDASQTSVAGGGTGAILDAHSGTPPTDSAVRDSARIPMSGPSEAIHDLGWHELYSQRRYSEALSAAKRVGFGQLTRSLSASKLVDLADAARLGGDSGAALEALRALEARFASVAAARDSDFLVARLLAQRGETGSAIHRLTKYLERGEGARYSLEAMGRLVELHFRRGDRAQAHAFARRYLERAPNGPYHRFAESVLEQR